MRLSGIRSLARELWNRKWVLSVAAGLLLGCSFPPIDLSPLQFIAFILLFRLAELSDSTRDAAFWSYCAFIIWNVIVTYWMVMATWSGGIAAFLANSLVMTGAFVVVRWILISPRSRTPSLLTAFLMSSVWTGFEYLHHIWDLAWPWLSLGNGWANYPSLIQYISYTGYLGISFWVVFTSALLYLYYTRNGGRRYPVIASAALILPVLLSLLLYFGNQTAKETEESNQKIRLVVVQPDFNSYAPYYGYSNPIRALQELIRLSDSLRTAGTDAVIWPENAVNPYISNQLTQNAYANRIRQMLIRFSSSWKLPIITGTTYYKYFTGDSTSVPPLVRNPKSDTPYIYYNAAVGFYPNQKMRVYKKVHLVPMVERIPFLTTLHQIDPFNIPWHTFPWYGKGSSYTQFPVDETRTPALVCYDSVFPHWMRGFIQRGAGFITIITNDGWWGDTSGHMQHFAYARLRAIEFNRWVARSANNGISGVIGPDGQVKKRTKFGTQTAFRYEIPVRTDLTFFARYGAWLPQLCLIAVFGYLVFALYQRFQPWSNSI